jgi:hypothetical protein
MSAHGFGLPGEQRSAHAAALSHEIARHAERDRREHADAERAARLSAEHREDRELSAVAGRTPMFRPEPPRRRTAIAEEALAGIRARLSPTAP